LTAPVPIVTLPLAVAEVILVARGGRDAEVEIDAVSASRPSGSIVRASPPARSITSGGSSGTCRSAEWTTGIVMRLPGDHGGTSDGWWCPASPFGLQ
jgi:hypothetical protein